MISQFAFLATDFRDVFEHAAKAEGAARPDPRAACVYARIGLEVIVDWLYQHDGTLREPYETQLAARIFEPTFRNLLGTGLVAKARIVKDIGNIAAHEKKTVPTANAVTALRELFHLSYWLARTYGRTVKPDPGLAFSPEALPATRQISETSLKQLQEAAQLFADAVSARDTAVAQQKASESERARLDVELASVRAEIEAIKAVNAAKVDTHDYNEAQTRDTFIDLLLHEAGWPLDSAQEREFPVTGMPYKTGEGFVDYVLWDDDGKPLGLVEAKRTRSDATVGQHQAKLYADCLEKAYNQRPIIFYSNGYDHWIWDDTRYPPRPVQGFYTKDELQLAVRRRATRRMLATEAMNEAIVERYYQHRAIRKVTEGFERDSTRKALLVMATGAGKTRTVIALCDLLMRANWVRRVLFLADRVALVNQAVNAFKQHLPSAAPVNLVTEKNTVGRVYVSTYPTMMGLIDETVSGKRRFGVGHFDLVVIDEAHRSVYRKYGAIFDYFDSLLIGLTATPKDEVDRDTYRLFELEKGLPTDAYGLDEAVRDHYLVPARTVSVPLKFPREGIKYDELSEEEKAEWDEMDWADAPTPSSVEAGALNTWLFNIDTVDKALEYLMTHGQKVASGDRLGKTIIFAKNRDHAQFIVERFDANYPHLKGSFAQAIDYKTTYAQSLIDDFSTPEKTPHIAVSIDMLDTGIDIPEIVNLVFFKVVRSKTKFWQMLGRGTRLRPALFGPGLDKSFFYVFDFCENFAFFNESPKAAEGKIADSLSKRLFATRVEVAAAIEDRQRREEIAPALVDLKSTTVKRLQDEVAAMSRDNFLVRPKRRVVEKYSSAEGWTRLGDDAQRELVDEIAGLPTAFIDDDQDAKQFDLLLLRAELAVIRSDESLDASRARIVELARLLEGLSNIPVVSAELELILEIQTASFWDGITSPLLENVRRRLRLLIKLIDIKKRPIIYTDFLDEIGIGTDVVLSGVPVGTDMDRYRQKSAQLVRAHSDHIAVRKLRMNEALTAPDLDELERIFVEAGLGTSDDLIAIRKDGGLGIFVRSLLGLDRSAAKSAFSSFISGRTLNTVQLDFVNTIIDHLTARGVVDPRLLYESPFTDIDPMGVSGVFPNADVTAIVNILGDIQRRAAA